MTLIMLNTPQKDVDSALDCMRAPAGNERKLPTNDGKRFFRLGKPLGWLFFLLLLATFFLYLFFWRAPSSFPKETLLTVKPGATLQSTGELFLDARLIRSIFWFKAWSVVLRAEKTIRAGDYKFTEPVPVWGISSRLSSGASNLIPIRVTLPEGSDVEQIATILKRNLPRFDEKGFLSATKGKEGYLFPDTYSFTQGISSADIVRTMSETMEQKLESISEEVSAFGKPLKDVLIMASLLEEEARTTETRRKVAGILWKRLEIGMPLQVDAVFPYILGKNTFEVTTEDLQTDSPYNTYKYAGLPPTPITNPGLDSILSAVTPIDTPYLYYLSDKQGEMHYAVNHLQHLTNKEKYLR